LAGGFVPAARITLATAVEVVDLLGREVEAVDGHAVLVVVVVPEAADDVDAAALAEVAGSVLACLPQTVQRIAVASLSPLRTPLLMTTTVPLASGPSRVLTWSTVTSGGQTAVPLFDPHVGHVLLLMAGSKGGGFRTPCPAVPGPPFARTSSLPPTGGRGVGRAPSGGKGWGMGLLPWHDETRRHLSAHRVF
jgi:hypothetical protein